MASRRMGRRLRPATTQANVEKIVEISRREVAVMASRRMGRRLILATAQADVEKTVEIRLTGTMIISRLLGWRLAVEGSWEITVAIPLPLVTG